MTAEHLVAVPGQTWSLWRWACLRGTGFPISLLAPFASATIVRLADAVIDATAEQRDEARRRYTDGYAAERRVIGRSIRELAADPRFREAVTWQNRTAVATGLDALLKTSADGPSRSRDRRHEELVAMYAQRYCVKNDTIGFFGPVGWARVDAAAPTDVVARSDSLLAARGVYFEQWPIDTISRKLSEDGRFDRWMRPRRLAFVRVDGAVAKSPVAGVQALTEDERLVLEACDGVRRSLEIAALLADRLGETRSLEALRALRKKGIIAWGFDGPLAWAPDQALRAKLLAIDDPGLQKEALAPLDALERARSAVADASGDAARLALALDGAAVAFTDLTGTPAQRHAGAMYAGRTLVFEDCRRDVDATIGAEVLAELAGPLGLLVTSARWFTSETAAAYRARLHAIHAELAARAEGGIVRFDAMWQRAQALLVGTKDRPLDRVAATLRERWGRILDVPSDARRVAPSVRDLAPRVREAFAADRPGWRAARYYCPDIMVSASSVEDIRRGRHELVLGEFHVGANTLDTAALYAQHPRPSDLDAAFARDQPSPMVLPTYSKDWLKVTVRTNRAFAAPWHYFLELGFEPAPGPRERILRVADLVVEERGGRLVVPCPHGEALDLIEFFGDSLSTLVANEFRVTPVAAHQPRVTIDRFVVARESWTFVPSEVAFAGVASPDERFLQARRWVRAVGMPRWCFLKSPLETKPMYIDFESPIFVDLFAKLVRKSLSQRDAPFTLSEMLPRADQAWLPDASGNVYACELRLVVTDDAEAS